MAKGARRISQPGTADLGGSDRAVVFPVEPAAPEKTLYPDNVIFLPVTPSDLARCIENQRRALIHIITDANSPPIDGGLAMITAGLDALARVVPTLPDRKDTP